MERPELRVTQVIALAGLSKFEKPESALKRVVSGKDVYVNKAMREGIAAEPVLFDVLYNSGYFHLLKYCDAIRVELDDCILVGHPDAIGIRDGEAYVVDFKLTRHVWNSIPDMYRWQVSLYGYIFNKLGYKVRYGTICSFSPKGIEVSSFDLYDDASCELVIKRALEFYLYNKSVVIGDTSVQKPAKLEDDISFLAAKAKSLNDQIKQLEAELNEIKGKLRELSAGEYVFDLGQKKFKLVVQERVSRFIKKEFLDSIEIPEDAYGVNISKVIKFDEYDDQ